MKAEALARRKVLRQDSLIMKASPLNKFLKFYGQQRGHLQKTKLKIKKEVDFFHLPSSRSESANY